MNHTLLFAALNRHVIAYDAVTGEQVWKITLPGFFGSFTTLLMDGGVLYAARSNGKLHALDPASGDILWTVSDKHLKSGPVMLASSTGGSSGQMLHASRQNVMKNAAGAGAVGGGGAAIT